MLENSLINTSRHYWKRRKPGRGDRCGGMEDAVLTGHWPARSQASPAKADPGPTNRVASGHSSDFPTTDATIARNNIRSPFLPTCLDWHLERPVKHILSLQSCRPITHNNTAQLPRLICLVSTRLELDSSQPRDERHYAA